MPVATMTGLLVGDLIAFAMVTETVFQWPGLGLLFVEAVNLGDRPIIAAYLMVASFIIVSINTLVDITYLIIDPRLRVSNKGGKTHA
jgi:peptide/nickel transport system permease protein